MNPDALVLVLGRPGPLRSALEALLMTITEVEVVQVASDRTEAIEFARLYNPALAILDGGLPGAAVLDLLAQIKSASPKTRCLVWLENAEQEAKSRAARCPVLFQGATAAEIVSTINELLSAARSEEDIREEGPDQHA